MSGNNNLPARNFGHTVTMALATANNLVKIIIKKSLASKKKQNHVTFASRFLFISYSPNKKPFCD